MASTLRSAVRCHLQGHPLTNLLVSGHRAVLSYVHTKRHKTPLLNCPGQCECVHRQVRTPDRRKRGGGGGREEGRGRAQLQGRARARETAQGWRRSRRTQTRGGAPPGWGAPPEAPTPPPLAAPPPAGRLSAPAVRPASASSDACCTDSGHAIAVGSATMKALSAQMRYDASARCVACQAAARATGLNGRSRQAGACGRQDAVFRTAIDISGAPRVQKAEDEVQVYACAAEAMQDQNACRRTAHRQGATRWSFVPEGCGVLECRGKPSSKGGGAGPHLLGGEAAEGHGGAGQCGGGLQHLAAHPQSRGLPARALQRHQAVVLPHHRRNAQPRLRGAARPSARCRGTPRHVKRETAPVPRCPLASSQTSIQSDTEINRRIT